MVRCFPFVGAWGGARARAQCSGDGRTGCGGGRLRGDSSRCFGKLLEYTPRAWSVGALGDIPPSRGHSQGLGREEKNEEVALTAEKEGVT